MALLNNHSDDVVNEINMTPLIDVMLVLLIVFMVTLPVITHSVKLELPMARSAPTDSRSPSVELSIDAAGTVSWNGQPLDAGALDAKLHEAAMQQPQPDIALHADRSSRYETVADLLAAMQRAGLAKINFVTRPKS
ncbi:ExbD/TolR family protein [Burkholderia cepacia]|uniref:ExbD/TolR family protein n=1 Tax=Burkholderia cepacia TaxID=292 RepID=UPI002ABDB0EC|nr:biopolymer transporter ExbD [Burkholderia cepacia]